MKVFNDCKVERHRTGQGCKITEPPRTNWWRKARNSKRRRRNSTWCVPSTSVESEDSRQEALNCSVLRCPCRVTQKNDRMLCACWWWLLCILHARISTEHHFCTTSSPPVSCRAIKKTRNTHSRVTDWEDWFDRPTKMAKKGHETLMVSSGKLAS